MDGVDLALLAAAFASLVVTGVLAAADTALAAVPRSRAQSLADDDRRGARALVRLVAEPDSFLTTLRLVLLTSRLAEATLVAVVAYRVGAFPALVGATLINVVAMFVLADAAPRTWAARKAEGTALALARPVAGLVRLPLLGRAGRLLLGLANLVVPGRGIRQGPYVAEQDPFGATSLATDEGVIEQDERELIESIIDFGDTVVREVMVPRPDMVTVDATFRVADVMEVMLLNGYSRLPACGDGIDDVVGLVYAKDLMRAERDGNEHLPVAELLRPAIFVPEIQRLPELLRDMQQRQFHMAIVLDEYGGTSGLVTLEDIMEELVGEIFDEYDVEDPMIEPLPGGDVLVRGRTPLDEVNELLNTSLPEGDWDTVGGLVYSRLGHVPVDGESVVIGGWTLTAQRIQGRRIGRVRISPPVPQRRWSGDAGQVGGIEALPLGVLIFVIGALLVANCWAVVDAKLAADAAAREAARSYVEAEIGNGGGPSTAEQAAVDAGLAAFAAYGRDSGRARVWLSSLSNGDGSSGFARCAQATFSATYHVPALTLPWIGGFGDGFAVSARHSELVDPFRDGLPGEATC
ncbi:MAG: hemolysin family protein [Acidimicrobiales bacterium]